MPLLLDLHPGAYPLEGYRRRQLLEWVFVRGARDFAEMTNLPAGVRADLAGQFRLDPFLNTEAVSSADGSVKYLFTLPDLQRMEAVYMPYHGRKTVCVSSMVGCPAGCAFCATGSMGFGRNLSAGEIVGQVLAVARAQGLAPAELRNLVFMGMGEPLLNYDATLEAARILLHPDGLGMSRRRVTLSTVGLPRGIRKLARETDVGLKLAISLHAPDEETRRRIIPTAHANSIAEILDSAREYVAATGRRVSFEYAMLRGVNDGLWQADLLAGLLSGLIAHVNLIPMNPWPGSGFEESTEAQLRAFEGRLAARGVPVSVRRSRGRDAGAACGQLASRPGQPGTAGFTMLQ